jgi:choline monooxygenase
MSRVARSFSGAYYTDPEVHASERAKIFAATWQPVGELGAVSHPGEYFTAEVAGEPVVVVRDKEGGLRAFYNVCRHRAGAVAEDCGKRSTLQCAYHGWTYGLDGALLHAPDFDGVQELDRGSLSLRPVPVATFGPFVFVNLEGKGPPLLDTLGGLVEATRPFAIDRLRRNVRKTYEIRCNWKVYVENYLEGYHIPIAHPSLFKALDFSRYRVITGERSVEQIAPMRSGVDDRALYYWVYPNWMLNVYTGNVSINIIVPLSVDRTLTIFEWYFQDPLDKDAIERTLAWSDEIQQEDIKLCEMVQKRLGSRAYDGGVFSLRHEAGVHLFQRLVEEQLSR